MANKEIVYMMTSMHDYMSLEGKIPNSSILLKESCLKLFIASLTQVEVNHKDFAYILKELLMCCMKLKLVK